MPRTVDAPELALLSSVVLKDDPENLADLSGKIIRSVVSRRAPYAVWSDKAGPAGIGGPRPLGPPLHFTPPPIDSAAVESHLAGKQSVFHYPYGLDGRTFTQSIRLRLLKNSALPMAMDESGTEFSNFVKASPWELWYLRNKTALPLRKYIKIQFRTAIARLTKDIPDGDWFATYDGEPYVTVHLRPGKKLDALRAYQLGRDCILSAGFKAFAKIAEHDVYAWGELAGDIKLATDCEWSTRSQGFQLGAIFVDMLLPPIGHFDDISLFEKSDRASISKLPAVPLPLGVSGRRGSSEPVFVIETDVSRSPLTEFGPADPFNVFGKVLKEGDSV